MTRTDALQALVRFEKPLNDIWAALSTYAWDSDTELVVLSRADVVSVLDRFLDNALSAADVEQWANAIEGRDDIGFEVNGHRILKDVIWELANPILTNVLNRDSASGLINSLRS